MIRVILVGYMGAGKTAVGRALAKSYGVQFYDLDWYITDRYRRSVKQIFDEQGEDGFRKLEQRMLHEVAEFEDVVISCGGGTPCFFDNMAYMNSLAETVYLKATPEVLCRHLLMGKSVRPLIMGKSEDELRAYIDESLQERSPFYEQAKHIIDITLLDTFNKIEECVNLIKKSLNK